jgi:hypothetical protein
VPGTHRRPAPAHVRIAAGETYDVELVTPSGRGSFSLEKRSPGGTWQAQGPVFPMTRPAASARAPPRAGACLRSDHHANFQVSAAIRGVGVRHGRHRVQPLDRTPAGALCYAPPRCCVSVDRRRDCPGDAPCPPAARSPSRHVSHDRTRLERRRSALRGRLRLARWSLRKLRDTADDDCLARRNLSGGFVGLNPAGERRARRERVHNGGTGQTEAGVVSVTTSVEGHRAQPGSTTMQCSGN